MTKGNYLHTYINKRTFLHLVVFLAAGMLSMAQPRISNSPSLRKVVIDAGHGGQDPGAIGKISKEKDITLPIALKAGQYITRNFKDVEVIYTRKDDTFIPLFDRADIANKNNADLFISIHVNANPKNREAEGTETYVMGLHTDEKNFEVAKKENSVIVLEKDYSVNYEGFDPSSPESYIIFSLMQNKYLEQSLTLAAMVQNEFREKALRNDRGVKQAGFLVLWRTSMPSILIETGFISNPKEEKYLMSEEGQDLIASAIYRAFRNYKNYIEGHTSVYRPKSQNSLQTGNLELPTDTSVVYFSVQILSSGSSINISSDYFAPLRKTYPDSTIKELFVNRMFKYVTGSTYSYETAAAFCKEIKKMYPGAFIIAIRNGKIIPLSQILNQNPK